MSDTKQTRALILAIGMLRAKDEDLAIVLEDEVLPLVKSAPALRDALVSCADRLELEWGTLDDRERAEDGALATALEAARAALALCEPANGASDIPTLTPITDPITPLDPEKWR